MDNNDNTSSWEEVSEILLQVEQPEIKKTQKRAKLKILHQILYLFDYLKQKRTYLKVESENIFEKYNQIQNNRGKIKYFSGIFDLNMNENTEDQDEIKKKVKPENIVNQIDKLKNMNENTKILEEREDEKIINIKKNIELFVNLVMNKINARIYFVINEKIESFIEYEINGRIVDHKKYYNGNIFSIDFNLRIIDQTAIFSKKSKYYKFFINILENIKKVIHSKESKYNEYEGISIIKELNNTNNTNESVNNRNISNKLPCKHSNSLTGLFDKLDNERIKKIPINIDILKIHPLYVSDSTCGWNKYIYPKRPVYGKIGNENVYSRSLCKILKTERGWYMVGRSLKLEIKNVCGKGEFLKPPKPFRIVNGKKLYAEFQTERITRKGLKKTTMEYFHEFFVPIDCSYVDCESAFCQRLDVECAECLVGFKRGEQIIKGVFVYKKDYEFVKNMYDDFSYYRAIDMFNARYDRVLKSWKAFLKKVKRYVEIRKYLGI